MKCKIPLAYNEILEKYGFTKNDFEEKLDCIIKTQKENEIKNEAYKEIIRMLGRENIKYKGKLISTLYSDCSKNPMKNMGFYNLISSNILISQRNDTMSKWQLF